MAHVWIRPLAEEDLFEIWSYLTPDVPESADELLEHFNQKFTLLAENPMMGRKRPELSIKGLRSFPLQHYIIFYVPRDEGVEIIRILHSRRDIENILGE